MTGRRVASAAAIVAVGVVAARVAGVLPGALIGIVSIGAVGLAVVAALLRSRPGLRLPVVVATAVRVVVLLAGLFVTLPDSNADAIAFQARAEFLTARSWSAVGADLIGADTERAPTDPAPASYSAVLATMYKLTGSTDLIQAEALNVAAGIVVVAFVFLITERLDAAAAARAAWIAALFPTLVLYSVVAMREALTVLALVVAAYLAIDWSRRGHPASLIGAAVVLLGGSLLHSGLVAGLGALGVAAVVRMVRSGGRGVRTALIATAAVTAVIVVMFATGLGLDKLAHASNGISVESIAVTQTFGARGDTAYLYGFVPHSFLDLVWQTPVRVVFFLFGPFFALSLRNPWYVVATLDGLAYLALVVAIVRNRRAIRSTTGAPMLLLMTAFLIVLFALGVSNFGTALRHRQKLVALLIPLASMPRQPDAVGLESSQGV